MSATGNELVRLRQLKLLQRTASQDASTKVDAVNKKLVTVNKTVEENKGAIAAQASKMTAAEQKLQAHDTKLGTLESDLTTAKQEAKTYADTKAEEAKTAAASALDAYKQQADAKMATFQTAEQVGNSITTAVTAAVASVYTMKGSVANQAALPAENAKVGDVYNTTDTGMNYVWNGTEWDALGAVTTLQSLGVTVSADALNKLQGLDKPIAEYVKETYVLPTASAAALGGVKNGGEVDADAEGKLKLAANLPVSKFTNDAKYLTEATLPVATDEEFKTFLGITE